jgi:uncharacterized protein YecT (DUF1311 family)
MRVRCVICLLLFVSGLCRAENIPSGVCSYEGLSSQEIYECSKYAAIEADKIINDVYRELIEKVSRDYRADPDLGGKLIAHIKKSQRAWETLRDENCAVESFVALPGTQAFESTTNYCLAKQSTDRAVYLNNLRF